MLRDPIATQRTTKTSLTQTFVLAAAIASIGCAGCRSGMPKMNMFGMGKRPSAETLAGSGPTTTYPVPPSAKSNPEAIASVAGGTAAPNKIAPNTIASASPGMPGVNSTPGVPATQGFVASQGVPATSSPAQPGNPYAIASNNGGKPVQTPAYAQPPIGQTSPTNPTNPTNPYGGNTPNYAAAAANGFPVNTPPPASNNRLAGASSPAFPPPAPGNGAPGNASSSGSFAGNAPPPGSLTPVSTPPTPTRPPASSFAMPSIPSSTSSSTPPPPSGSSMGGGFTMPDVPTPGAVAARPPSPNPSPAVSAITLPAMPASAMPGPAMAGPAMPGSAKPATDVAGAAATRTATLPTSPGTIAPAGYQPGSTGTTTSYPGASKMVR